MLTDVRVLAGSRRVARLGDVVAWFETGPEGGGLILTELLQTLEDAAAGTLPPAALGARLAAVLNRGGPTAVPALAAATPERDGLRVVVHGWGAVVAGDVHVPNGWVDEVVSGPRSFFLGRNTVTPGPAAQSSLLDLEAGVVPGDGVSFVAAVGASGSAPGAAPGATETASAPTASSPWAPPAGSAAAEAGVEEPAATDRPGATAASLWTAGRAAAPEETGSSTTWPPPRLGSPLRTAPPPSRVPSTPSWASPGSANRPPGRLVLDDGHSAVLERTCVVGRAPHGSPAVQTGIATPLTVVGTGVADVHAEIRVEHDRVAVRDLGGATTFVLAPGTTGWIPLAPGEISPISPGTRVALGDRTIVYERP